MLKQIFLELLQKYSVNTAQKNELWEEIEKSYSNKKRHYHTLKHLENLLEQLTGIKEVFHSWDSILFTLYYHDIIYNALRSDNEEKSAQLAEKRMTQLSVPDEMIRHSKEQIQATKTHNRSVDSDTNYFTDADLSILGQDWETYTRYSNSVRKEYSIYPDLVYNPGRKKVLNHFLSMDRIFKTDWFYDRFEKQAKQNLQTELTML